MLDLQQGSISLIKNLDVNWDNYQIYERQNSHVIQFNLKSDSIFYTLSPLRKGDTVKTHNLSSVVFIEYNNGKRLNFFMKVIEAVKPDGKTVAAGVHYGYIPSGFTGIVMYYTLGNQFINGYKYTDGRIEASLKNLVSNKPAAQQTLSINKSMSTDECGYEAVYGYSTHYWWFYSDYTGWILNSEQEYGFLGWAKAMCLQPPDPGGNDSPGGGVNGDSGGIGGPPPPPLLAPQIIKDSLTKYFPCATSLIVNVLENNPVYKTWTNPFTSTLKPDLTWQNGILPWNASVAGSTIVTYMLGETGTYENSRNATITLNTSMLQNSSKLLIAAAAIHETLHAYINYNIVTNIQFSPPPSYNGTQSWLTSLDYWVAQNALPPNYRDHYEMLIDYFDQAVSILKAWDNSAHTDQEYRMAMLFGLDTNDLLAMPASNPGSLSTVYNQILTKYSINEQVLQAFWKAQLNAATNKLPSSGCPIQ